MGTPSFLVYSHSLAHGNDGWSIMTLVFVISLAYSAIGKQYRNLLYFSKIGIFFAAEIMIITTKNDTNYDKLF